MTSTGPSGWRASASWRPSCACTRVRGPGLPQPQPLSLGHRGAGQGSRPGRDRRRSCGAAPGASSDAVARDPGFWLIDDGRTAFAGNRLPADVAPAQHRARSSRRVARLPRPRLARPHGDTRHHVGRDRPAGRRIVTDGARRHGGARCAPVQRPLLAIVNQRLTTFRVRPAGAGLAHRRAGRAPDAGRGPDVPRLAHKCRHARGAAGVHYLASTSGEIYFALVTDWLDSPTEHADGDDELLARARDEIERLNQLYGDSFLLLHRARRFNPADGVWMGWERKRGKLDELNRLLRGDETTSFTTVEGACPTTSSTCSRSTATPGSARSGSPPHRQARSPAEPAGMGAGWWPPRGFGILHPASRRHCR